MDPLSRRVTVTMQPERATGWHNASTAPPQRTLKPNYAPLTLSDPAFTQIRPLEPAPNSIQESRWAGAPLISWLSSERETSGIRQDTTSPRELPCFSIVSGGEEKTRT